MSPASFDPAVLEQRARQLVPCARELSALGWTPATSGNFSARLDGRHVAITISGVDKGRLTEDDVMVVDLEGRPVGSAHRPSAEALLHTQVYRRFEDIGAVLHTHSVTQTVASRLFAKKGFVRLEGYELFKAFRGNSTHEAVIQIPVLQNRQELPALAAEVERCFDAGPLWGYLIDGHGIYAWGRHIDEARRHLEAFDFLLACELEMTRISR